MIVWILICSSGMLLLVRHQASGRRLLIANTHLYWNPQHEVRLSVCSPPPRLFGFHQHTTAKAVFHPFFHPPKILLRSLCFYACLADCQDVKLLQCDMLLRRIRSRLSQLSQPTTASPPHIHATSSSSSSSSSSSTSPSESAEAQSQIQRQAKAADKEAEVAVIMTGDLNSLPDSDVYALLSKGTCLKEKKMKSKNIIKNIYTDRKIYMNTIMDCCSTCDHL